jgi:hypothetical protein
MRTVIDIPQWDNLNIDISKCLLENLKSLFVSPTRGNVVPQNSCAWLDAVSSVKDWVLIVELIFFTQRGKWAEIDYVVRVELGKPVGVELLDFSPSAALWAWRDD